MLSFHSAPLFFFFFSSLPSRIRRHVRAVYIRLGKKDEGRFLTATNHLFRLFPRKSSAAANKVYAGTHSRNSSGFANFRVCFIPSCHFSSLAHSFCHSWKRVKISKKKNSRWAKNIFNLINEDWNWIKERRRARAWLDSLVFFSFRWIINHIFLQIYRILINWFYSAFRIKMPF